MDNGDILEHIGKALEKVTETQEKIDSTLTQYTILQEMVVSTLDKSNNTITSILRTATTSMEDTKEIRRKLFENGMSSTIGKIIDTIGRVESKYDQLETKLDKVGEQSSGLVIKLIVALITGMIASAGIGITIMQILSSKP